MSFDFMEEPFPHSFYWSLAKDTSELLCVATYMLSWFSAGFAAYDDKDSFWLLSWCNCSSTGWCRRFPSQCHLHLYHYNQYDSNLQCYHPLRNYIHYHFPLHPNCHCTDLHNPHSHHWNQCCFVISSISILQASFEHTGTFSFTTGKIASTAAALVHAMVEASSQTSVLHIYSFGLPTTQFWCQPFPQCFIVLSKRVNELLSVCKSSKYTLWLIKSTEISKESPCFYPNFQFFRLTKHEEKQFCAYLPW